MHIAVNCASQESSRKCVQSTFWMQWSLPISYRKLRLHLKTQLKEKKGKL